MAKHEGESTYISMDNTRISEKTFSVPLGFGGYLLTIEVVAYGLTSILGPSVIDMHIQQHKLRDAYSTKDCRC